MPSHYASVIEQVAASMSARTLRHAVIASNIANRDTVGYQRLTLRFDEAMSRAAAVAPVRDTSATPVSLEQDLVALSANAAHYEAMAQALSRYFSIIGTITSESRG